MVVCPMQEATKASRLLNQQLDDATNHEVKRKQARAKLQAAVAQVRACILLVTQSRRLTFLSLCAIL